MRKLFFISIVLFSLQAANAQSVISPFNSLGYMQNRPYSNLSGFDSGKKWFVSQYSGITAGYSFFNGGSGYHVAAPIGLQLNRRINNNLFAFAGVSATPLYTNFNQSFLNTNMHNGNLHQFNRSNLGLSTRAEVGFMYINDARTFSVSGRLGVERYNGGNPFVPASNFVAPVPAGRKD